MQATTRSQRTKTKSPYLTGLLAGALSAVLVLGIVGRVVMRFYALATSRPVAFSITGTARLLLAAALGGAVVGLFFAWIRPRLSKWPALTVGPALGLAVFAAMVPGMQPPGLGGGVLFLLLFLAFGALLEALWVPRA